MKPIYAMAVMAIMGSALSLPSQAQTKSANVITTAVPFLRVAPDARSAGMGDVGLATSPDAYSSFFNMGKLAFNEMPTSIGVSYTPWLSGLDRKGAYLLSFSGYHKLDATQAISGGVRYLTQGNFNLTDEQGSPMGTVKPSDLAIEAGYSRKLTNKLGVGLGLRYIHSKLAGSGSGYQSGSSVAADLGFFFTGKKGAGQGWNFGAALTNLGAKIGYLTGSTGKDFIPANLGLGTSYTKLVNKDNKISFAADLNKLLVPTPPDPTDIAAMASYRSKGVVGSWFSSFGDAPGGFSEELKEFQLGLGAEYTYKEQFSVRAGYSSESASKGDRNYVTLGAGLHYNMAGLNFSYLVPTGSSASQSPLKNTFRLSLLFSMNKSTPATK
jgi:hypothetical protein